jgi:hypothetical protein
METVSSKTTDLPHRTPEARRYDRAAWHSVAAHPAMTAVTRATRLVSRGLVLFVFSFVEIIAELLAPIVLVFGIGWAALPAIVSVAGAEGQAREFLTTLGQAIPKEIHLGRTAITPLSLIVDGVFLVAVVALCRTVQTLACTND